MKNKRRIILIGILLCFLICDIIVIIHFLPSGTSPSMASKEAAEKIANTPEEEILVIYSGNTSRLELPEEFSEERYQITSSDEKIVEADQGVLIAKAEGKALITAVDKTTNEVYETVVEARAGKLSLKVDDSNIETDQTTTVYPVLTKGVFSSISYTSSNPSVASVTLSGHRGLVRGGGTSGTAEITAVADICGTTRKASITVSVSQRTIPVGNPQNASDYTQDDEWSGDRLYFGHYEQDNDLATGSEPILWRVLEVTDDAVFLLSEYGLEDRNIIDTFQEFTWETSSLRKFLNGEFLETAFTGTEANAIIDSLVETEDNPKYGTSGGKDTEDKVFLLSVEEVTNPAYGFYPDFFKSTATRTLQVTEYSLQHDGYKKQSNGNTCWWLRTMGLNNYYAAYIYTVGSGTYHSFVGRRHDAVRPAIRVDLASVSFIKQTGDDYYTLLAD
ncbi:MAG: DUF6273 domain-containing protein [Eubacteriales bacterium]|nr:DUF6273 domain-containing protein [Eubacteriales bacterium]